MAKTYFPRDSLMNGYIYEIYSRNLLVGVWKEEVKGFIGIRAKFEDYFLFTEFHPEVEGEPHNPYGTARAFGLLAKVPENVPLTEHITEMDDFGKPIYVKDENGYIMTNQALYDELARYDIRIVDVKTGKTTLPKMQVGGV